MPIIKCVAIDWDGTLAKSGTAELFLGAADFLKALVKIIPVYIITARPSTIDPTDSIASCMQNHHIKLERDRICWTHKGGGYSNEVAAQQKVNRMLKICSIHIIENAELLFIDDNAIYREKAREKKFQVKEVPRAMESFGNVTINIYTNLLEFIEENVIKKSTTNFFAQRANQHDEIRVPLLANAASKDETLQTEKCCTCTII